MREGDDEKMSIVQMENEHCMLLALPCGRDHMDVLQQSNNLTAGFITYLQRKQAAGIVNIAPPGHHQVSTLPRSHTQHTGPCLSSALHLLPLDLSINHTF